MGFRERLRHEDAEGAIYDGDFRYMMIRTDALMGLFARLPVIERQAALEALGASVRERGKQSAQSYVAGDRAALLATIEATAPELGWGVWQFAQEGDRLTLTVANSPFAAAAGFAGPVCHAIVGMAASVGEIVLGVPCRATETACAAGGWTGPCTVLVEPAVG